MKDKVAIVTGAASGIGKDIARAYLAEGAKVAIADLKLDGANAAAKELTAGGGQAIGVAMDVANEEQGEGGGGTVIKSLGGGGGLGCRAGTQSTPPRGAVWRRAPR